MSPTRTSGEGTGGEIGGKTDILINTARHVRPGGVLGGHGVRARGDGGQRARADAAGAGLRPGMASRTADGVNSTPLPSSTSCRCMRCRPDPGMARFPPVRPPPALDQPDAAGRVRASGLRVMNVYRSDRRRMASAAAAAKSGAEGAGAQVHRRRALRRARGCLLRRCRADLEERWRRDPKVLEREWTGGA
jgi:hypothetical protein